MEIFSKSDKGEPLFGVGTGDQMDAVHVKISPEDEYLKHLHHLHNIYLEIFTQFGLIGLIIFLNIFYQIFKYKDISTQNRNVLWLSAIIIAFAILTESFTQRYYLPLLSTFIVISIANNKETFQSTYKKDIYAYISIFILITITSNL